MGTLTTINTVNLEDFIDEVNLRGLKRVYREWEEKSPEVQYSAYDPATNVHIKAQVVFSELNDILRMGDARNHRRWYGGSRGWTFNSVEAKLEQDTKKDFIYAIRKLGVSKEIVALWNSAKVGDMAKIIKADTETAAADGNYDQLLKADALDGLITQIRLVVEAEHDSLSYTIYIRDWGDIFQKVTEKYEQAFVTAGIKVIHGNVTAVN
jgi:hypothetical protein